MSTLKLYNEVRGKSVEVRIIRVSEAGSFQPATEDQFLALDNLGVEHAIHLGPNLQVSCAGATDKVGPFLMDGEWGLEIDEVIINGGNFTISGLAAQLAEKNLKMVIIEPPNPDAMVLKTAPGTDFNIYTSQPVILTLDGEIVEGAFVDRGDYAKWSYSGSTVGTESRKIEIYTESTDPIMGLDIDGGVDEIVKWHNYGYAADQEYAPEILSLGVDIEFVPDHLPPSVTSISKWFKSAPYFNDPNISDWDTSKIVQMIGTFQGAITFNQPLNWDTSNVEILASFLEDAESFNQPLEQLDVKKVFSLSYFLKNATSFNQPLNDLVFENLTNIEGFLWGATSFNQPLDKLNVSTVENFDYAFFNATAFNQPLHTWVVSSAHTMEGMFYQANNFIQDLSTWCVSLITDYPTDFTEQAAFPATYLPVWGTCPRPFNALETVITVTGDAPTLKVGLTAANLPTDSWVEVDWGDDSPIESIVPTDIIELSHTYSSSSKREVTLTVSSEIDTTVLNLELTGGDLGLNRWGKLTPLFKGSRLNVMPTTVPAHVSKLSFLDCDVTSVEEVIGSWDIGHTRIDSLKDTLGGAVITSMSNFNWYSTKITDFSFLFSGISCATNPDTCDLDLTLAKNMESMFSGVSVDFKLTNAGSAKPVNLNSTFMDCVNLTGAGADNGISTLDVSEVTNMDRTFYGCPLFEQSLIHWCVPSITEEPTEFNEGATLLTDDRLPSWGYCPLPIAEAIKVLEVTTNGNAITLGLSDLNSETSSWTLYSESGRMYHMGGDINETVSPPAGTYFLTVPQNVRNALSVSTVLTCMGPGLVTLEEQIPLSIKRPYYSSRAQPSTNLTTITFDFSNYVFENANDFFYGCEKLNLENKHSITNRYVTSVESFFEGCASLTASIHWDLPKLTSMHRTYANCTALSHAEDSFETLPIVKNFSEMFYGCTGLAFVSILANSFNEARNMDGMFTNCSILIADLKYWCVPCILTVPENWAVNNGLTPETSPVWGTCPHGFGDTVTVISYPTTDKTVNLTVGNDVATTTQAIYVRINGASEITIAGNGSSVSRNIESSGNAGEINLIKIRQTGTMSDKVSISIDSTGAKIWQWCGNGYENISFNCNHEFSAPAQPPRTRSFKDLFSGCNKFNDPVVGQWTVSGVESFEGCFRDCNEFNVDISNWNFSSATNLASMFKNNYKFNQPLNDIDVSNVTNFSSLFDGASVFNQPLDKWDVSSATNMNRMFQMAHQYRHSLLMWCVAGIPAAPINFSASLYELEPVWGTCPSRTYTMDITTTQELMVEATQQLAFVIDPSVSAVITEWSLDAPAIAAVSDTGVLTGVSAGEVTITVLVNGYYSTAATIRIVPKQTIVAPTGLTITEV